jgi:cell division protein FtsI/penicillin-binding protein 2
VDESIWFVGFASNDDKEIAIAVVLEDIYEGSGTASNVTKTILDQYLQ